MNYCSQRVLPGRHLQGNRGGRVRGITAESALDLAEVLGTSAKLWMNLQATWDLDLAVKRGVVV